MTAYPAQTRQASASTGIDLFLGPAVIALALLFSLLLPVRVAHAQLSGAAGVDYAYQRSMARIVAGSAAGLQVSSPTTMNILNAGRVVGTIALNEKRLIDLATLARVARASTIPGVISLGATYLLQYGLQKCADGTWCKPNPSDPTVMSGGGFGSCQAAVTAGMGYGSVVDYTRTSDGAKLVYRILYADDPRDPGIASVVYCSNVLPGNPKSGQPAGLYSWVVSSFPTAGTPVAASDADVETAWKGAFQANPFVQQQVWGFEDPATQNQQWADALAQLAEVTAPSSATVADPATSTTTAAGTTTSQRTCTYAGSANASASTQKDQPLSVGVTCVTTTTNPDGTTSTKTETTSAEPKGAAAAPTKVEVDTCGLPGKPACKIDETGTATEADGKAKVTAATADLTAARQDAVQRMNDAAKQTEFGLHLPQFLPGGSCQPITFFHWRDRDGTVDLCDKLGFIRTLLSWLWGTLAAIYIYNKVAGANA